MPLRLRPYLPSDEKAARAAHEALLPDDFFFLLFIEESPTWTSFLERLEDQRWGRNLTDNRVRALQLAAVVDGDIVGRVSIRFELNDWLARYGGHVGYGVVPTHRRKGYATEMLRQALVILRADGIERVLVTCDDTNIGSASVIEACGGVLEDVVVDEEGTSRIRRYWIE